MELEKKTIAILAKKEIGDINTVAKILGVTHPNADRILKRPNAKLHARAIDALKKIIDAREKLIKEESIKEAV